jgi:hypothetical protein
VAVLDKGIVVEYGPPAELLGKDRGPFKSLVAEMGSEAAARMMELAKNAAAQWSSIRGAAA